MKYYAKQLLLSFFIGSTIILWGLLFQFSALEIFIMAGVSGVFQYVIYGGKDESSTSQD